MGVWILWIVGCDVANCIHPRSKPLEALAKGFIPSFRPGFTSRGFASTRKMSPET